MEEREAPRMTHKTLSLQACVGISALAVASSLFVVRGAVAAGKAADRTLWYARPARNWQKEALPLGNGRLGCMIFGDVSKEHIQFNEDTLWVGDEKDTGAYQAFGNIYVDMAHPNPEDYRRELDISEAIHRITYTSEGVRYRREYFASYPAGVMVFHFTASRSAASARRAIAWNSTALPPCSRGPRATA